MRKRTPKQPKPPISQMSKNMLLSELNALYYSNWTPEDYAYRDKLVNEYHTRIESEGAMAEGAMAVGEK